MTTQKDVRVHPTAEVSPGASVGAGTSAWHQVQVREGASVGRNCVLSKGVYVDQGVVIGDNVKVQNYVSIYHGVTLEDGVFCGPHCVFTNDKRPRAINADGTVKAAQDWTLGETLVKRGAAIGANAVIVCGVTVGAWAMVGAGAVVTRDVPDHGLVFGNPSMLRGFVCHCGGRLGEGAEERRGGGAGAGGTVLLRCEICGAEVAVSRADWEGLA